MVLTRVEHPVYIFLCLQGSLEDLLGVLKLPSQPHYSPKLRLSNGSASMPQTTDGFVNLYRRLQQFLSLCEFTKITVSCPQNAQSDSYTYMYIQLQDN